MEKKFIKFLKAKGAYENFKKSIADLLSVSNITLHKYLAIRDPLLYLEGAFIWAHTIQGYKYWEEINAEWYKTLFK